MRNIFLAVFILSVMASSAYAAVVSTYSINFDIRQDMYVDETINVSFNEDTIASNLSFTFDGEISDVKLYRNSEMLAFSLAKDGRKTIIKISEDKFVKNLIITFKTNDLIFQLGDKNLFFSQISFPEEVEQLNAVAMLPEGFGISDESYTPETGSVDTDGRRISVEWTFSNQSSASLTIKFESLNKGFNLLIPVSIALALIAFFVYIKLNKKTKEDFLKGFSKDEKKVLEYLEKNPIAYQNKIEQEFKFSRAKMTRISQKFEAKGLIEKKKKGRTNKIVYKR